MDRARLTGRKEAKRDRKEKKPKPEGEKEQSRVLLNFVVPGGGEEKRVGEVFTAKSTRLAWIWWVEEEQEVKRN